MLVLHFFFRFVILKVVRKDLIPSLPLPRRMIDYLSSPHYYSEHLIDVEETEEPSKTVTEQTTEQTTNEDETNENIDMQNLAVSNYVLIQNPVRSGSVSGEQGS